MAPPRRSRASLPSPRTGAAPRKASSPAAPRGKAGTKGRGSPPPPPHAAETERRTPRQTRSKDRVDAILTAARQLIGERGNDAVSMREIAAHAGVSIASVYDYFPDKNGILRELMAGYMGKITSRLAGILLSVETVPELFAAIDAMVDAFVAIFREERELPTIWGAVQANTTLRNLDVEDGRRIAEFLIARFLQVLPHADPEAVRDACLYAVSTVATTVRMALYTNPKDGERLIREFKTLMRIRLESLAG